MKPFPLVSILIPLYNAEKYFDECMQSVVGQTYQNIEVIIVDDGSADKSLKIARRYEKEFDFIKVCTQENAGAASARNKAFGYSNGDYIQYLDADDILHPEKIALQIKALHKQSFDPFISAIGKWARFYVNPNNALVSELKIYKSYNHTLDFLVDTWSNAHYSIIHSWLISRELHNKAGLWDDNISVLDDGVFFARVAYASQQIICVPDSIVYWRQDNLKSLSKDTSEKGMRSHLMACNKYAEIVIDELEYPGMSYALALQYSICIYRAYPHHMNIVGEAEASLKRLGYNKPLAMPSKKFQLLNKVLGFYPTAWIFIQKDKTVGRMRNMKKKIYGN